MKNLNIKSLIIGIIGIIVTVVFFLVIGRAITTLSDSLTTLSDSLTKEKRYQIVTATTTVFRIDNLTGKVWYSTTYRMGHKAWKAIPEHLFDREDRLEY